MHSHHHPRQVRPVIVDVVGGRGRGGGEAVRLHETLRGLLSQGYACILANLTEPIMRVGVTSSVRP